MIFIGQILYGYCGGVFGRDGYGAKRIEAYGANWVVARGVKTSEVFFASWVSTKHMLADVEKYSVPEGFEGDS